MPDGSVVAAVALSPGHPQQATEGFFPIEHAGVTDRAFGVFQVPTHQADGGLVAA